MLISSWLKANQGGFYEFRQRNFKLDCLSAIFLNHLKLGKNMGESKRSPSDILRIARKVNERPCSKLQGRSLLTFLFCIER